MTTFLASFLIILHCQDLIYVKIEKFQFLLAGIIWRQIHRKIESHSVHEGHRLSGLPLEFSLTSVHAKKQSNRWQQSRTFQIINHLLQKMSASHKSVKLLLTEITIGYVSFSLNFTVLKLITNLTSAIIVSCGLFR